MSSGIPASIVSDFKSFVERSKRIVICAHENPDADAYGSSGGLGLALRALGKEVVFINSSPIDQRLKFIGGVAETGASLPDQFIPDSVIICDCGAFSRVGDKILPLLANLKGVSTLNIDHHISNDHFGDLSIVITQASSTAEVVCALLTESGFEIPKESAIALYAGIIADSGSFRYSCVRPYTFEAASLCVSKGASPWEVSQKLFSNNSASRIKLHSKALLGMTFHLSNKVAVITSDAEMMKSVGAQVGDSDGLAEQGRDIEGILVSILFKEDRHPTEDKILWRISLRSKTDQINLSELAEKFGGGGHKVAAAFRSTKPRAEIEEKLLAELTPLVAAVK